MVVESWYSSAVRGSVRAFCTPSLVAYFVVGGDTSPRPVSIMARLSSRRYTRSPTDELEMAELPAAGAPNAREAFTNHRELTFFDENEPICSFGTCRRWSALILMAIALPIVLVRVIGETTPSSQQQPSSATPHLATATTQPSDSFPVQHLLTDDICCFNMVGNLSTCAILCPEDAAWIDSTVVYVDDRCPTWPGVAPDASLPTTGYQRNCALRGELMHVAGAGRRRRRRRLGGGAAAGGGGKGGGRFSDLQTFSCRVMAQNAHGQIKDLSCRYAVNIPTGTAGLQTGPSTSRLRIAVG